MCATRGSSCCCFRPLRRRRDYTERASSSSCWWLAWGGFTMVRWAGPARRRIRGGVTAGSRQRTSGHSCEREFFPRSRFFGPAAIFPELDSGLRDLAAANARRAVGGVARRSRGGGGDRRRRFTRGTRNSSRASRGRPGHATSRNAGWLRIRLLDLTKRISPLKAAPRLSENSWRAESG